MAPASNFTIRHVDTCHPCYLQDHCNRPGETLASVPVDNTTTYQHIFDALVFDLERSDAIPASVSDADVRAAIVDMFAIVVDMGAPFDSSLDAPPEDDEYNPTMESCCVWFRLSWDAGEESDA